MKKFILLISFALILFSCKQEPQHLIKIEAKLFSISNEVQPDREIEDVIKPFTEKVTKEMNTVLTYTAKDLVRTDGEFESSLGNLMADLCYQRANPVFNSRTGKNIDFVMLNYGGIRAGISKGTIKVEHAFNLMPFENSLVVVELTADKILELIEYFIKTKKAHPISKQVNLVLTKNGFNLKINGKEFDKNSTYFVLTSDYLQNGGDHMMFFKNPITLEKLDYKVRNAIIDYFTEIDTLNVKLDGRISTQK